MESPSSPPEPDQGDEKVARESRRNFTISNGLILAFLGLTIVGCLVVLPRPTYPQVLPLPRIDRAEQQKTERQEIVRALAARDGSLDHPTRAVGEQIRRIGALLARGKPVDNGALHQLRDEVKTLLTRPVRDPQIAGEEALLRLRALQGQMFLEAAHSWERSKDLNTDLEELGGPFHKIAAEGWLDEEGRLVLDDDALRLFFRVHWGKLTGVERRHPFQASLEEIRRYYLTNLVHPLGAPSDVLRRTGHQMNFARSLGKIDAQYPSLLALGILELRIGQVVLARDHLADHLKRHPDGRWTALARNHLMLATSQSNALLEGGL